MGNSYENHNCTSCCVTNGQRRGCRHCYYCNKEFLRKMHKMETEREKKQEEETQIFIKEHQLEDIFAKYPEKSKYMNIYFESLLEPGTFYKKDHTYRFQKIEKKYFCENSLVKKQHILSDRFKQKKEEFLKMNPHWIRFEHYYIDLENKKYYLERNLTEFEQDDIALSHKPDGNRFFQCDYGERYDQLLERYYAFLNTEKKQQIID